MDLRAISQLIAAAGYDGTMDLGGARAQYTPS